MKTLLLLLSSFFLSFTALGQASKAVKGKIIPEAIKGSWRKTSTNSTFGHTSELRFTFTLAKNFVVTYLADNDVKEQYTGKYEIANGNILKLSTKNKPNLYFKIIEASLDFLKLQEKDSPEIIQLVRE